MRAGRAPRFVRICEVPLSGLPVRASSERAVVQVRRREHHQGGAGRGAGPGGLPAVLHPRVVRLIEKTSHAWSPAASPGVARLASRGRVVAPSLAPHVVALCRCAAVPLRRLARHAKKFVEFQTEDSETEKSEDSELSSTRTLCAGGVKEALRSALSRRGRQDKRQLSDPASGP